VVPGRRNRVPVRLAGHLKGAARDRLTGAVTTISALLGPYAKLTLCAIRGRGGGSCTSDGG